MKLPAAQLSQLLPSFVALSGLLRRAKKGGGVGQAAGYSAKENNEQPSDKLLECLVAVSRIERETRGL